MTPVPAFALYRRSTAHQDLSLEQQAAEIRAWAEANGYGIVGEFSDTGSGLDTEKRRGFLSLVNTCADPKRRAADTVLVYDVSRFSRLEPDEAAFHEFSLRRVGVKVVYIADPEANLPGLVGTMVKGLKRSAAHDFSLKLSQTVRRGMQDHARRGGWTGGRPPFGYRRALVKPDRSREVLTRRKAKGERSTLVVDPREADVVLEIYDAYTRGGVGIATIANSLNARGVGAPTSYQRIGPGTWTKGTLWAMLRSPIYIGVLVTSKARYSEIGRKRGKLRRPASEHVVVEGAVPAIMPHELWEAAQRRHGTRRFGTGGPWRSPYLLSTMVSCACGRHYQGKRTPAGVTYYVCGGRLATGPSVCSAMSVPTAYLDTAVLDGIVKRIDKVLEPGELRRRLAALVAQDTASHVATVPDLTARLGERERRIARLVEVLAAGSDYLPSVRTALVGLERERSRLTRDLADARARAERQPAEEAAVEAMLAAFANLPDILAAGDPEERKRVAKAFLAGVKVDHALGQATLRWYRLPHLDERAAMLVDAVATNSNRRPAATRIRPG